MFYCVLIREEVPFHSRQEAARFGCRGPFKSSYWSAQSCWCCCCCWWRRCELIGCGCQGWGARGMLLHISPSPPPPSLPASLSLSFSLALYRSLTISLLLAHIPLNNPHLGQAGWEAIQCSAPLCRLRKETESERQRFSTQEGKKSREILTRTGRYQELTEDFHLRISFIYTYCLYIYIYIFVHTHIDIYIYIHLSLYISVSVLVCLY